MDELISRQAIHDTVTARYPDSDATQYSIGYADAINDVIKDILYMPSAQKTGKWMRRAWSIECSECGYDMPFAVRNYCPNCGCRMVEPQESEDKE